MSNELTIIENQSNDTVSNNEKTEKLQCGLIMPISEIDGLSSSHWGDVRKIIEEAISEIKEYDISVSMVSESNEVRVIQKTIVQRIYGDDIVIVDVSAKNPNVMFELGIRLAFDKPFVLLKDRETNYTFDISSIYHIEYPRDLRYKNILDFKSELKEKLILTYKAYKERNGASLYLKDFGALKVSEIKDTELPLKEYLEAMFKDIKRDVKSVSNNSTKEYGSKPVTLKVLKETIEREIDDYKEHYGLKDSEVYNHDPLMRYLLSNEIVKRFNRSESETKGIITDIYWQLEYFPF